MPAMATTTSEQIRARAGSTWDAAVTHRLFRDIAADTVSDGVFRRYLRIEFGFIDTAAAVMGYAVAKAPTLAVRAHLSAGLFALTTDQVDYFASALGGTDPIQPPLAAGLHDHFHTVARDGTYHEIIACMLAAEWLYATWCATAHATPSSRQNIADWVALHADAPFVGQVDWMRHQIDTADIRSPEIDRLADVFTTALAQEILFHDAAYD